MQTVTIIDDYGNDKTVHAASYTFTRALFKKINWDNFSAINMMKIAPGFEFDPEFKAVSSEELGR
jgi:hypothetical protein